MPEDKWGAGNKYKEKAFDTTLMGKETIELFFGEFPHSRQDNTIYARTKGGSIYGFSGHRQCFKIEIEEHNYLKSSELSGDEIRKGCNGKLFLNGLQIFSTWHRDYERCYRNIQKFILDMEEKWSWYPKDIKSQIGKTIGYSEQLFKIKSIDVEEGDMILQTADGKPRKRFLWEDKDDEYYDETLTEIKVGVTSENICWFPKQK